MDKEALKVLEEVNQLRLDDAQRERILTFLEEQHGLVEKLDAINTENVERMVHVMPICPVLREDVSSQPFTREALQEGAPETMDGYWQVPRVVE